MIGFFVVWIITKPAGQFSPVNKMIRRRTISVFGFAVFTGDSERTMDLVNNFSGTFRENAVKLRARSHDLKKIECDNGVTSFVASGFLFAVTRI